MPITPNIIHTAKHTVNASVLMIATDHCRVLSRAARDASATFLCAAVLECEFDFDQNCTLLRY
jgi:hypothetical protein